jgi:hypothetical protein
VARNQEKMATMLPPFNEQGYLAYGGDSFMSIRTRQELEVTRGKLRRLEEKLATLQAQPATNEHVRELEMRTLHKWINRFKEEIARFEAHATSRA